MTASQLTIALPKGTLLKPSLELLGRLGLPVAGIDGDSRSMIFDYQGEPGVRYIMCRPTDVPVYVEHGAADLGFVGKDTIAEQGMDVYELVDLKYGYCRFVVAVPEGQRGLKLKDLNYKRVATKFPGVASQFFREQGLSVEIIKLHGNIELAPLMGLADVIVDISSTGRSLKENRLCELHSIMDISCRLISNRVSYRTKHQQIQPLVNRIQEILRGEN